MTALSVQTVKSWYLNCYCSLSFHLCVQLLALMAHFISMSSQWMGTATVIPLMCSWRWGRTWTDCTNGLRTSKSISSNLVSVLPTVWNLVDLSNISMIVLVMGWKEPFWVNLDSLCYAWMNKNILKMDLRDFLVLFSQALEFHCRCRSFIDTYHHQSHPD